MTSPSLKDPEPRRMLNVLNLGAGVQSTAIFLMAHANKTAADANSRLPYPSVGLVDACVFADTGEEPLSVYHHLQWLISLQFPPIISQSRGSKLGDDLLIGKRSIGSASHNYRFASIPAYTAMAEGIPKGIVRRQCTKEYKVEIIERAIRRVILGLPPRHSAKRGTTVYQIAGISLDEAGRASRMMQQKRAKYLHWKFPLIAMNMTRQDCIGWLAEHGNVPHRVPRSACVFCPYHSDAEWLAIKESPEDWKRAVEIDEGIRKHGARAAQGLEEHLYIHRSCKPLVQIEFKPVVAVREQQININFNRECEGMCGV